MNQTKHESGCFIKTFQDAENHFVKRIWNIFVRLDTLCYYRLCDVIAYLCSLKVFDMVTDSFSFIFHSIMFASFQLFSTPEFNKTFHYHENKDILTNLYSFSRKTIKQVAAVEVPKSRNKICLVFGFLFYILPEFVFRKLVLAPLMFIPFGLLLMTSWVGVFVFVPLLYMMWYIIKLLSKIILVFLAIVTTAVLSICVLIIAATYFVFMTILFIIGSVIMFIIYPLLFGFRIVILSVIALVYYLLRGLSLVKTCCFVTEEHVNKNPV